MTPRWVTVGFVVSATVEWFVAGWAATWAHTAIGWYVVLTTAAVAAIATAEAVDSIRETKA